VAVTRADAERMDRDDALASFRERFVIGDPELLYLDGNSLGRLPVATRDRLTEIVQQWSDTLVAGWEEWIDLPVRTGDAIAEVIGARPGEVIACDSTTVNLYKLAAAVIDARDVRSLGVDPNEFPTDRYVFEGLARRHGLELRPHFDADLTVRSVVDYRTGEITPPVGEGVIWDLSHAAGSIPMDLARAEFAIGCTYKYLNSGPGGPAFLYVRKDRQEQLRSPIWGWFGQRDQFDMERPYDPEPDVRRFLAGTPGILGLVAAQEGARLTAEAGIERIRAKSMALTDLLVAIADERLAPLGFTLGSPREAQRRGSQVSLRHEDAWRICRALIEGAKVVPDFRRPDNVRFGLAPLYTRFVDVYDALDRLVDLVERREHERFEATPARVT
jgi:kynureninase